MYAFDVIITSACKRNDVGVPPNSRVILFLCDLFQAHLTEAVTVVVRTHALHTQAKLECFFFSKVGNSFRELSFCKPPRESK